MTTLHDMACRYHGSDDIAGAEALAQSWLAIDRFRLAYGLWCEGLSVIPLLAYGKRPARKWKRYQTQMAELQELIEWFVLHDYSPAVVTGAISGITVIDCDSAEATREALGSGYRTTMRQRTRRGVHLVFAHDGERNTVRLGGSQGVDRRGEGGYVRAYGDSYLWTRSKINQLLKIKE